MYTTINFKTKKALKEAVKTGKEITIFQPGPFGEDTNEFTGTAYLEGPHYPDPHCWYAKATIENGIITKIE